MEDLFSVTPGTLRVESISQVLAEGFTPEQWMDVSTSGEFETSTGWRILYGQPMRHWHKGVESRYEYGDPWMKVLFKNHTVIPRVRAKNIGLPGDSLGLEIGMQAMATALKSTDPAAMRVEPIFGLAHVIVLARRNCSYPPKFPDYVVEDLEKDAFGQVIMLMDKYLVPSP